MAHPYRDEHHHEGSSSIFPILGLAIMQSVLAFLLELSFFYASFVVGTCILFPPSSQIGRCLPFPLRPEFLDCLVCRLELIRLPRNSRLPLGRHSVVLLSGPQVRWSWPSSLLLEVQSYTLSRSLEQHEPDVQPLPATLVLLRLLIHWLCPFIALGPQAPAPYQRFWP